MGAAAAVALVVSILAAEPVHPFPGVQWATAEPAEVGMDRARLGAARDYALTGDGSGIITRHGKVVLTWGDPRKLYDLKSTTKSFGATAVSVALLDGKLKLGDLASKHQPSIGVPPEENRATGWLEKITIHHLLTQTAGFEKPGGYQPLLFEPGTKWKYSDSGPNWLAECLTLIYQRDLNDVMFERVFTPIGIQPSDLKWRRHSYRPKELPEGIVSREFGSGISANVDAMARVGYLYLRGGRWNDKQILPRDFVEQAGRPQPDVADLPVHMDDAHGLAPAHYGLLWWNNGDGTLPGVPRDAYWSWGLGDSLIVVIPSLDIVAARAGNIWKRQKDADHYKVLDGFLTPIAQSVTATPISAKPPPGSLKAPYPPSTVIGGMEIDWSTHMRLAPGSDNWQATWADDDHLYAPWGDGGGFDGTNSLGRVSLGVGRIEGTPPEVRGTNVFGGKDAAAPATVTGKSWGILCVEGVLYMWVSPGSPLKQMQSEARLHRSADHGRTWQPADWAFKPDDLLTIPTICQFGRDYAGARDGYVYHYFTRPTGGTNFDAQKPGEIYLARVEKGRLMERGAYEFCAGTAGGEPRWTADVTQKQPVFEDANGVGWCMSVSYNKGLKRYVLITEHTASHAGLQGVFDAPEPWGPWATAVYRSEPFSDGKDPTNTFFWNMPTKWHSADGRDAVLVYTGGGRGKDNDSFNAVRVKLTPGSGGAPYPASSMIKGIEWSPAESVTRLAPGGDNWPMTWADDGEQYTAYGDGRGFKPFVPEKLSLGIARVEGSPRKISGVNIHAPTAEATGNDVRGRKASGMLCVDGVLYMLARNTGNSQLAWSSDRGATWTWADWKFTTSFGCPSLMNAGKNYADAPDGFVYVYSFDSGSAYTPADRMVLARVPTGRIKERGAYEFFAGLGGDGAATWSRDVNQRAAIFENPGKCYRSSVTYVPGVKRYVMVQTLPLGEQRPREYGLAVFEAAAPWGPWRTVEYSPAWDIDAGESASIPSKWLGGDGRSLHLVFAGGDSFAVRAGRLIIADK